MKCENVFLDGNWTAKLGDFGLATSKSVSQSTMGHHSSTSVVGTAPWMAPHLVNVFGGTKVRYSRYTDIYAFGMVLYEILTHMLPWERELQGLPFAQLTTVANMGILQNRRPSLVGVDGPGDFIELIEKSWVQNAGDRQRLDVTIETIRRHVGDAPQAVNAEAETERKEADIKAEEERIRREAAEAELETAEKSWNAAVFNVTAKSTNATTTARRIRILL